MEERQLLEGMQCDLLQGYLFSRPLSPAVVEDLLQRHAEPAAWLLEEESQIWRPLRSKAELPPPQRHELKPRERPVTAAYLTA